MMKYKGYTDEVEFDDSVGRLRASGLRLPPPARSAEVPSVDGRLKGAVPVKRECPVTGEPARVNEAEGRLSVEHPKLGRYVLDTTASSLLEADAGARQRIARWIGESRSLGLELPSLTVEHVHLFQRLADLEDAVSEWHELRQAIKKADEERLWMKLRLEWNYNSNHIEGNTLTYHETELLLIHGRTAGGHPMRDYEEMKAHDVAIDHTRSLAAAEQVIGERDIRGLNQILLKEPFWQNAETPDGQPTRKRIVPGQYKRQPNHVRTATGELHRFAEPEETPARMEGWTRDFRRDLERTAYPLPLFLAESHWGFLRIHPFDDGNGRTARVLANYALLRKDLPPIVIKSEDRDRYISALQNADLGFTLPIAQFMLENVLWSLQIGIRAAKGESITEPDDVAKEVELFIDRKRGPAPVGSDMELLNQVFYGYVKPTLEKLDGLCERQGSQLFRSHNPRKYVRPGSRGQISGDVFETSRWKEIWEDFLGRPGSRLSDKYRTTLGAEYAFEEYVGTGSQGFDLTLSVMWELGRDEVSFEAAIDKSPLPAMGYLIPYSELASRTAEVDQAVEAICRCMMDEIDGRSKGPQHS